MELITLKNQLSDEFRKLKRERNQTLITELHEKINQAKISINKNFRDRQKENLTAPIKRKQVLDAKKSSEYQKKRIERRGDAITYVPKRKKK